ncbi:hypothetical protein, partial [Sulfuricurvum sp. MLSB]|uniref:hypothetical protein n=1 Tax=Sulfuricurvum sp. MLSB TaxID=1537917 RepID=UPI00056ACC2A
TREKVAEEKISCKFVFNNRSYMRTKTLVLHTASTGRQDPKKVAVAPPLSDFCFTGAGFIL